MNRFVCFVSSVITQSCHSVVTMTLTNCEIRCWFFMNLTAWEKLVFLPNCYNFPNTGLLLVGNPVICSLAMLLK